MSRGRGRGRHSDTAREAEFQRAVDDAKQRHNISDVARRHGKVVKAGREWRCLCFFHSERTPSMQLNDAKGTYHCFGCTKGGDILSLTMHLEGVGFADAIRLLGAELPQVDPAQRIKAAEEDAAERAAAIERAQLVWERMGPVLGSPGETYARARGITMPLPDTFRFGLTPAWYDDETGECGPDLPALVGAVVDGDQHVIGIQRIFLAKGGRAKANMAKPKRSLGRIKGGALRIHALLPTDKTKLIVTEGPEDGLSLAQELPDREVWVTLGTAMMPEVQYPPIVKHITIAGQNDAAGRAAVEKAETGLLARGFTVSKMFPRNGFKDWNDQLRGIRC